MDELRREYRRLEGKISAPRARLIGGLPDSAKQSLNRCQQLHTAIENLGGQVCSSLTHFVELQVRVAYDPVLSHFR